MTLPNAPMRLTWRCLAIGGCVVIGSLLVVWYMRVSTATAAPTTSTSVDQFTIYAPSDEPITPIPQPPPADPGKVSLGERLFRDTRMSHDNKWTCTACHDVGFNGALRDPRTQKTDVALHQLDTLTVFNSALSFRQSWEGNKRTLEEQIRASIAGKRMMRSTPDEVAGKLRLDPAMERDFRHAYGHEPDGASVVDSLVTYMRSLLTPGSRFDRWLQGDSRALSPQEVAGYQLFKSLGCVSCHQGVNIGGNLFQRHGIFHPLAAPEPVILRVPSLRNVAATPPYFHDGSAATLEVAVRKMGNAQLNSDLSDEQIASVVSFLRTLTGRYQGREIGTDP